MQHYLKLPGARVITTDRLLDVHELVTDIVELEAIGLSTVPPALARRSPSGRHWKISRRRTALSQRSAADRRRDSCGTNSTLRSGSACLRRSVPSKPIAI